MFSYDNYKDAANFLGCEPELVEAVVTKEVGGKNAYFTHQGAKRLKILFERHVFWRELVKRSIDPRELLRKDPSLADILSQQPYDRYGRFITQYERRARAAQINQEAALAACSYSAFQIMGCNYQEAGFKSITVFVAAMESGSEQHLAAFCQFCQSTGADKLLQACDIEGFARSYNGPNYYKRGYHIELSRIYQRILARNLPRHESVLKAVATSQTVQRAGAVVATAATPVVTSAVSSGGLGDLLATVQDLTAKSDALINQVDTLHKQAEVIAPFFNWLPWAAGGWTALLLLIFAALVHRYLRDRGYLA